MWSTLSQTAWRHLARRRSGAALSPASCLRRSLATEAEEPKRTALYEFHVSQGAKMVPFAGYAMPVSYPDLSHPASHLHTRQHVRYEGGHVSLLYQFRSPPSRRWVAHRRRFLILPVSSTCPTCFKLTCTGEIEWRSWNRWSWPMWPASQTTMAVSLCLPSRVGASSTISSSPRPTEITSTSSPTQVIFLCVCVCVCVFVCVYMCMFVYECVCI